MLEKFTQYFERIEMPPSISARAEAVCSTFQSFIDDPIKATFVSDAYEVSPQKESIRRYNSLWLVSERDVIMECKQFVVQSNIDFMRFKGSHYCEMTAIQFDDLDGPSTVNSRLTVTVRFSETAGLALGTAGLLTACHTNCNYLVRFFRDVLWPHLR